MFDSIKPAPPDPILGLNEAYKADPDPEKINLGVGVYQDADGRTPVLASVKEAEVRLLETESTKGYEAIAGDPAYGSCVRALLLGAGHPMVSDGRAVTAQTPGGTGGLRVAGDYLKSLHPEVSIWVSEPTWPNHQTVFEAAGVAVNRYAYFDAATNGLAFDAMLDSLSRIRAGDVVLLHGGCHNPTGVDPGAEQWARIAQVLAERRVVPLVDISYQGFGDGLEADAAGLRAVCERVPELMICSSFSKNVGLYRERVGAITIVAASPGAADSVFSHLELCIRRSYSNPPAHGGAIVRTILTDASLRDQWEGELGQMRDRINGMRRLLVDTMAKAGAARDFSFLTSQRGMFSLSGLTRDQVGALRRNHSIYILGSGRINVAGMTERNMDRLCAAICGVL